MLTEFLESMRESSNAEMALKRSRQVISAKSGISMIRPFERRGHCQARRRTLCATCPRTPSGNAKQSSGIVCGPAMRSADLLSWSKLQGLGGVELPCSQGAGELHQ